MKGHRRYIALIAVLLSLLVLLDYFRPKPVDWTETFLTEDKNPYGTYALYQVLPDLFAGEEITLVQEPVYNHLQDSTTTGNYLFIHQSFEADHLDLGRLLDFVHRGNQVFIAAEYFISSLEDTLHFKTDLYDTINPDSTALVFTDPALAHTYSYPENNNGVYFEVNEQTDYIPLGRNKAGKLNFMQVPFGLGSFYLSSVPLSFTNYALLTADQSAYAATALSHLPVQHVFYDEYQKQQQERNDSLFGVLVRYESLAWAYYLALFTTTLFLLFQSKRTQRIIPQIEPPRNTTLDFVKVIGSLYFKDANHKNVAEKKITYFLEFLRLHYHLSADTWDEERRRLVAVKTGADEKLLSRLFEAVPTIRQSSSISEQTLLLLHTDLEEFYKQTSRKPLAHN